MRESCSNPPARGTLPIIEGAGTRALYVHGLLMRGFESCVLTRRLARRGVELTVFRYGSRREAPPAVARRLGARLAAEPGLHVVAHSFGGPLTLAALANATGWTGRAVLVAPPVAGSVVARRLLELPSGAWWLGAAGAWLTAPRASTAPPGRVAVIAGIRNVGIGRLLGLGAGPADGLVRVGETYLAGAPSLQVHATHVELLFSRRVADAVAVFLRTSRLPTA